MAGWRTGVPGSAARRPALPAAPALRSRGGPSPCGTSAHSGRAAPRDRSPGDRTDRRRRNRGHLSLRRPAAAPRQERPATGSHPRQGRTVPRGGRRRPPVSKAHGPLAAAAGGPSPKRIGSRSRRTGPGRRLRQERKPAPEGNPRPLATETPPRSTAAHAGACGCHAGRSGEAGRGDLREPSTAGKDLTPKRAPSADRGGSARPAHGGKQEAARRRGSAVGRGGMSTAADRGSAAAVGGRSRCSWRGRGPRRQGAGGAGGRGGAAGSRRCGCRGARPVNSRCHRLQDTVFEICIAISRTARSATPRVRPR